MKILSSPRELAGSYEVRQVLGQSGRDLVFRGDGTVVRRGNDVDGAIDGRPVAGLSIRIPESRILNAPCASRKTRGPWSTPSAARAHLPEEQGSYNDALHDWEILRTIYNRYPGLTFEVRALGEKTRPANPHRIQSAAR
jgi:hypothetical protein